MLLWMVVYRTAPAYAFLRAAHLLAPTKRAFCVAVPSSWHSPRRFPAACLFT